MKHSTSTKPRAGKMAWAHHPRGGITIGIAGPRKWGLGCYERTVGPFTYPAAQVFFTVPAGHEEQWQLRLELHDLEAKATVSDQPENAIRRTPEELQERYRWSARMIVIRRRLGELFALKS